MHEGIWKNYKKCFEYNLYAVSNEWKATAFPASKIKYFFLRRSQPKSKQEIALPFFILYPRKRIVMLIRSPMKTFLQNTKKYFNGNRRVIYSSTFSLKVINHHFRTVVIYEILQSPFLSCQSISINAIVLSSFLS